MSWILHHWPSVWAMYDPTVVRALVAVSLAVLASPSVVFRRI